MVEVIENLARVVSIWKPGSKFGVTLQEFFTGDLSTVANVELSEHPPDIFHLFCAGENICDETVNGFLEELPCPRLSKTLFHNDLIVTFCSSLTNIFKQFAGLE